MMSFIWFLIIGGIIGWLAGVILGKDIPGGVIGNIIAGIIGSWIGSMLIRKLGLESFKLLCIPCINRCHCLNFYRKLNFKINA